MKCIKFLVKLDSGNARNEFPLAKMSRTEGYSLKARGRTLRTEMRRKFFRG